MRVLPLGSPAPEIPRAPALERSGAVVANNARARTPSRSAVADSASNIPFATTVCQNVTSEAFLKWHHAWAADIGTRARSKRIYRPAPGRTKTLQAVARSCGTSNHCIGQRDVIVTVLERDLLCPVSELTRSLWQTAALSTMLTVRNACRPCTPDEANSARPIRTAGSPIRG